MGNRMFSKVIITEPGSGDDSVHIKGIDYISLCGWCDVSYVNAPDCSVTCPKCLALIKYCKSISVGQLR
jgi:hypothetical protein